jgi:hypothetical protein
VTELEPDEKLFFPYPSIIHPSRVMGEQVVAVGYFFFKNNCRVGFKIYFGTHGLSISISKKNSVLGRLLKRVIVIGYCTVVSSHIIG